MTTTTEKRWTLGKYRDLCAFIGGEDCRAVQFLDDKIAHDRDGRDAEVLADDSQMWLLLAPMLIEKVDKK